MIPLDSDTRKLQAFLSGAAATTNPTVTVSFYDVPQRSKEDFSEYRRSAQFTVLAGTTETDICAAPNQGTVRNVEIINIYNADTATVTVTICVDDNGTNRILAQIDLLTTETALWNSQSGDWQLIT
jgi:hypothetical protein